MLNAGLLNIIIQIMYTHSLTTWSPLKASGSSTNQKQKKTPAFYACSHQPATCTYHQPDLISPRPSIQFPQDPF